MVDMPLLSGSKRWGAGAGRRTGLRVYVIGRGYQATDIDTGEAARKFLTWLADEANVALTEIIQTWLWLPADAGGLGSLAESAWELALLRAEVVVAWHQVPGRRAPEGRARR
jgi:hypothetical protein